MLCEKCGYQNDDGAKFCALCRDKLPVTVPTPVNAPIDDLPTDDLHFDDLPMNGFSAGNSFDQELPADFTEIDPENYDYSENATPAVAQKKSILKKWWFWAIGLLILAVIASLVIGIASNSSGGSGGGGGSSGGDSSSGTYVSPYVTIVKTTKNSTYGITYGAAFDSFFTNPKWSYFLASSGEHVVEFTGKCYYDNKPANIKFQFILDMSEGTLEVYHLSINGEAQNRLTIAAIVKKIFESYP